jgi:hypothetical protein
VNAITRDFDVQLKDIRQPLKKGDAIPRGLGAHPALGEDNEQQLINWITTNARNRTGVNRTELQLIDLEFNRTNSA